MANVSVLMATYNGERYVEQQISSILTQTFKDFTLFISDDGSTDKTLDIVKKMASVDQRIQLLPTHQPTGSSCRNFLYLLDSIESDIYLFCDQDDVWTKDHIEVLLRNYDLLTPVQKKLPTLVHSDLTVVDKDLRVINKSYLNYMNLPRKSLNKHTYFIQNNVTGCVMLINNALKESIFIDKALLKEKIDSIPMHDAFFASVAAEFGNILFINEKLELYRQHDKNVVGAMNVKSIKYLKNKLKSVEKFRKDISNCMQFCDFFCDYYKKNLSLEEKNILCEFCEIIKFGRIRRLFFLIRYRFIKHGFIRNLFFLISIFFMKEREGN